MTAQSTPPPHIILYPNNKHVWSPFVIKLETRLRLEKVPYKAEFGNFMEAPKGKIPYVQVQWDGNFDTAKQSSSSSSSSKEKGELVPDSTLITKRFIKEGLLHDLYGSLDEMQRASDLGLRALLEDKFYFLKTHEAWTHHFPTVRDHILGWLPSPLRQLLGYTLYRKVQSGLDGQGTGRLTDGEVGDARTEIWGGVASALAKNTNDLKMASGDVSDSDAPVWFFGGGGPSEVDAVLFAAVVSILVCEAPPKSQEELKRHPILIEYARRIHKTYFPDYESWE